MRGLSIGGVGQAAERERERLRAGGCRSRGVAVKHEVDEAGGRALPVDEQRVGRDRSGRRVGEIVEVAGCKQVCAHHDAGT